jgi:hypothetical protein
VSHAIGIVPDLHWASITILVQNVDQSKLVVSSLDGRVKGTLDLTSAEFDGVVSEDPSVSVLIIKPSRGGEVTFSEDI